MTSVIPTTDTKTHRFSSGRAAEVLMRVVEQTFVDREGKPGRSSNQAALSWKRIGFRIRILGYR